MVHIQTAVASAKLLGQVLCTCTSTKLNYAGGALQLLQEEFGIQVQVRNTRVWR